MEQHIQTMRHTMKTHNRQQEPCPISVWLDEGGCHEIEHDYS